MWQEEVFYCSVTSPLYCSSCRDAPEATGDEPEDMDFDMPKIYEPVSCSAIDILDR